MFNKDKFNLACKIKGYGSYDKSVSISEIEKIKKVLGDEPLKVKPKVITCLNEYIDYICSLNYSYENPVFYRGQGNANFPINPTSLRKNPKNENFMIEAFSRHFSSEVESCTTDMARLVLMQHFGLGTRALDISESPLAALYFACSPMKKFCTNYEEEMSNWGEVVIFRNPEENKSENQKPIHSNTVSILSSTAFMEETFSLWKLGMEWKKDNNYMRDEKYINLKDIVRRSVIVRVPHDNQRIKNQQGAFILVNANEVESLSREEKYAQDLTDYILNQDYVTFDDLLKDSKWHKRFENEYTWELEFKKIKPYSGCNKNKIFDTDPFDLRKLYYRDGNDIQQVVLIPPKSKQNIIDELKVFNITEDFIYPDMDNVAHEIMENVNKE